MDDASLKTCVSCRWCRSVAGILHRCYNPEVSPTSMVTGEIEAFLCETARRQPECGPRAKKWESNTDD